MNYVSLTVCELYASLKVCACVHLSQFMNYVCFQQPVHHMHFSHSVRKVCFLQSLHMTVSKVSALCEFLTDIFILHLKQSVHYLHHLQSMHYLYPFQAVHCVYLEKKPVHSVRPQNNMHFVHLSHSVVFVRFLLSVHYMCL